MAKKKKKVKTGILKRKQEKKYKLQKQKRSQKSTSKKVSMQNLQQELGKLGLLIFEPEFAEISVTKERLQAIYEKKEEMPLQIMEFVDENVYQNFLKAITDLIERTPESGLKSLSLQSVLQFMKDEKPKQHMNQLVVAKYYQLLSDNGLITQKITPENILQVVNEYEKEYGKKLPHYQPKTFLDFGKNKQIPAKTLSPIENLHQEIKEYVSNKAAQEQLALVLEDLEIFFVDFLQEKEITSPEQITPLTLKKFVSYAKQNLNPTTEDLENIAVSLGYLQKALHHSKIFDGKMFEKASKINIVEKD